MDAQNQQGSGKKKNKNNNKKELDQESIKLMEQKMMEIQKLNQPQTEDPEYKELRSLYKRLQKVILEDPSQGSDEEKHAQLTNIVNQLTELNFKCQEDIVIFKRLQNPPKQDKEMNYLKENQNLQNQKFSVEQICREQEAKVKKFTEHISQVRSEEAKKREEIKQNFYSNFTDVKQKIQAQEDEANQFAEENVELKKELEQLIKDYDVKEKEFWEKVQQKESQQKAESSKYMEKFEIVQQSAQKAIQQKMELEAKGKAIQQKHLKLKVCSDQFKEFLETMDRSHSTLIKLKEELIKMANSTRASQDKKNQAQARADESDQNVIKLVQKTKELKEQIKFQAEQKEKLKQEILELNAQIKKRDQVETTAQTTQE